LFVVPALTRQSIERFNKHAGRTNEKAAVLALPARLLYHNATLRVGAA
jgi:hypothetical protein